MFNQTAPNGRAATPIQSTLYQGMDMFARFAGTMTLATRPNVGKGIISATIPRFMKTTKFAGKHNPRYFQEASRESRE